MDLAKTLIRTVVRAFYETRHVLVIDALMVHSALPNEDLALLLGMQQKDLRKLCGKLREEKLVAVHQRLEQREGAQRPYHRDYYYIDFHITIDAIKYKVFHLTKKVKDMYKPSEEKKDYRCPRCKAEWTQMEVLDNVGTSGFLCHRCGSLLQQNEQAAGNTHGHEKSSKLMTQLDKPLKLLQQIDSEDIPQNDFETAIIHAIPIQRDEYVNPSRQTITAPVGGPPATVKGITQAADTPLELNLTTSSELSAAEQVADAERKAAIANANVMPVWHTQSTITGESAVTKSVVKDGQLQVPVLDTAKTEEKDDKNGIVLDDELAAYYAQMAEEKNKEAQEDAEFDDTDDDGGEFEDVGVEKGEDTLSRSLGLKGDEPIAEKRGINKTMDSIPNGLKMEDDNSNAVRPPHSEDDEPQTKKIKPGANSAAGPLRLGDIQSSASPADSKEDDDDFEDAI